jgi:membrane-bound lytic murein transglycosylase D
MDAALFERGRSVSRWLVAVAIVACVLIAVAFHNDSRKKAPGNGLGVAGMQNGSLETIRASGGEEYLQIGRMIGRLINYDSAARDAGVHNRIEDVVEKDTDVLMKEFGAEEHNVPLDFIVEVTRFVQQFQGRDHDLMARALADDRGVLERMRQILRRDQLPEDLAYIALVESGFSLTSSSHEGAAGAWQFTEATAREYGMEVSDRMDERLDLSKSTEAASRYIRDLILDFGSGSSVLLALAAYNEGPEKVRHAVRSVKDPIKQRNFWYLYQTRALPEETREYVPKVLAAILIGRNPGQYGF